jgi:hypothetical protein
VAVAVQAAVQEAAVVAARVAPAAGLELVAVQADKLAKAVKAVKVAKRAR